jgi:hypothetical protein
MVGNAFTYQGQLLVSGNPAAGLYDLEFKLFDAPGGGVQFGIVNSLDNVAVVDGRFTVSLDFGTNAFGSGARWLDISVRPGAGGLYTLLSPRQRLNAAPYALAMPNVYTNEFTPFVGVGTGYAITGADVFGVRATTAPYAFGGMYIDTSDPTATPFYGYATGGVSRAWTEYVGNQGEWRLYNNGYSLVAPSGGGLEISATTINDGLRINTTADDGIQIGGAGYPNFGIYIPSPGVPYTGVWSNTTSADGNYGFYTPDNIEGGVITTSGQTVVAKVASVDALRTGDVVAATGVADPVPGGTMRLALVQRAGLDAPGVVGVVANRMEWRAAEGKEGEMILMPAAGEAHDGDYVSLVVMGVADVRVERGASITKGMRLTAADAGGAVRAMSTASPSGMPAVGVALENSSGRDTVPVFVNLR